MRRMTKRYYEYRTIRRKHPGLSAEQALRWAKAKPKRELDWDTHGETARFTFARFDVIVRKVTDEHPDLSWLGKITDKWEPGAVKLREGEGDRWGRQSWYVSCNHPDVAKEARSLNQDHGRERHTADCEVRRYRTADLRKIGRASCRERV